MYCTLHCALGRERRSSMSQLGPSKGLQRPAAGPATATSRTSGPPFMNKGMAFYFPNPSEEWRVEAPASSAVVRGASEAREAAEVACIGLNSKGAAYCISRAWLFQLGLFQLGHVVKSDSKNPQRVRDCQEIDHFLQACVDERREIAPCREDHLQERAADTTARALPGDA